MLRVRLLGELQAEADGAAVVPPPGRRAWSLLGWLALHPGEHARGSVAARFWPDVLDSSARASLRSALWELRRALGEEDALHAGRDRIALALRDRPRAVRRPLRGRGAGGGRRAQPRPAARRPRRRLGAGGARRARRAPRRRARPARRRGARPGQGGRVGAPPARARPARRGGGPRPHAPPRRRRRPPRGADRLRPALGPAARGARARAFDRRPARWPARSAKGPAHQVSRTEEAALSAATPSSPSCGELWAACAPAPALWPSSPARAGSARRGSPASSSPRARTDLARAARCTAVDLGGATPFGPWAELLAGLAPSSTRPARTRAGRRSWRGSRRRSRAGSAARAPRSPRRRRSWPARACSRPPSSCSSTPPPSARSCSSSTTSTSPTWRRSSSPPTSRGGSSGCRSCSC